MELMTIDGKRSDGRAIDELRHIKIETGVISGADGSAYLEWGNNKVYATVYGPKEVHPRHLQRQEGAIVQAYYFMAPFSVTERKRPGFDRRSLEISKLTSEALSGAIISELFPRASIEVNIDIIEADAGTRCAGITAASVALANAAIPMTGLVGAVSVGKVENTLVLDLNKDEDNHGQSDLPMAIIPNTGEIVLLQMDGNMSADEISKAMDMGKKAIMEDIHEIQSAALKECANVTFDTNEEEVLE